jgi:hypothetical protein
MKKRIFKEIETAGNAHLAEGSLWNRITREKSRWILKIGNAQMCGG